MVYPPAGETEIKRGRSRVLRAVVYILAAVSAVAGLLIGILMGNIPVGVSIGAGTFVAISMANREEREYPSDPEVIKKRKQMLVLALFSGIVLLIAGVVFYLLRQAG